MLPKASETLCPMPCVQVRVAAALARIAAQPEQALPDKQQCSDKWVDAFLDRQRRAGARPAVLSF